MRKEGGCHVFLVEDAQGRPYIPAQHFVALISDSNCRKSIPFLLAALVASACDPVIIYSDALDGGESSGQTDAGDSGDQGGTGAAGAASV